eukprot:CFRG5874T1
MESKTDMTTAHEMYDNGDEDIITSKKGHPFKYKGRYCWGGMSRWVFIAFIVLLCVMVLVAILVPVLFIVVGSSLAQSTTDNTLIQITNQSIVFWGQNYYDSCKSNSECNVQLEGEGANATCTLTSEPSCNAVANTIPNILIMNQTLTFSEVSIPGVIQSGRFDLYYTEENRGDPSAYPTNMSALILIGDLYVPEIDLHGVSGGTITVYDIEVILRVRDPTFFSKLAALASAPGMGGIWNLQTGSAVVEADLLGTRMYYKTEMSTWLYNVDLLQCDGPMSALPPYSKDCPCKNTCIEFSH